CSADRTRLLSNFDRLFPGASIEVVTARTGSKQSYADKLLDILCRPGLPDTLTTKWIGQQIKTPWRNVSKHLMIIEPVQRAIAALGWRYASRKGRAGCTFERVPERPVGRSEGMLLADASLAVNTVAEVLKAA